jgi:hypothetical protein
MSNKTNASPPPKRRRLLRLLLLLCLTGVVLLVGSYFLLTSGAFLKGVVVPRVGQAMNAELTVSDVALRPFSQLVVRDLKLVPNGQGELLSLKEARVNYSLMNILRGNFEISAIILDSPKVTVTQSADGSSNFDPLLESSGETAPTEPATGPMPRIRLTKFEVNNASVLYRQKNPEGGETEAQVDVPRFALTDLANSETARTELEAAIRFISRQGTTNHELAGTITGKLTAALNSELLPEKVEGQIGYRTTTATGAFAEAAGLAATLKANISPTRFEELALSFARGELALGQLTVTGPFDMAKLAGDLRCEISGIGPEVLSLLGGPYGIGFGQTRLAAAYDVQIADGARSIQASGTFRADRFSVVMDQLTTPPLDLSLSEDVAVDLNASSLNLKALKFDAVQNGQPQLTAQLSQPLRINWAEGLEGLQDSTFEVVLANLDFRNWQALLGPEVQAGQLGARLNLAIREAGDEIAVTLASRLRGLTGTFGSAQVKDFGAALNVDAVMTNLVVGFRQASLTLPPTAQAENRIELTGHVDARDTEQIGGHLKLSAKALDLTPWLAWFEETGSGTDPATPPAEPESEPEAPAPLVLPLKDFVTEATVTRLDAGEIVVENFATRVLLDGGRVVVEPLQLVLNDAPAHGVVRLDMSQPAWGYDIELDAPNVPLAPLVNTFQPERKGVVGGTISAVGQIQGSGFTGEDLRRSLQGSFDIGTTNLALKLVDVKNPLIRTVAGVATELPALLRNPSGALTGLVGRLTGGEGGGDPAWLNTLSQPPINVIALKGGAADGIINLDLAALQTPAFRVGTSGKVTLASSLMDSAVSLPVQMSFSRSLAAKLGQLPANTPTNQAFVQLPAFFSLGGTLTQPKRELKAMVLAQMGAASAASLSGDSDGVAQQIGGALNLLGGLTGGQGDENARSTNAAPSLGGLLEGVQKATGGSAARTNQSGLGGLLDGLLRNQPGAEAPDTNAPPAGTGGLPKP